MTGEQLQAMRDRLDNKFIDEVEEAEEEMTLDDKPEGDSHFKENYYRALQFIYKLENELGEKVCIKTVESDYKEALKNTYKYKKDSLEYQAHFAVAHALKDYLDGEA